MVVSQQAGHHTGSMKSMQARIDMPRHRSHLGVLSLARVLEGLFGEQDIRYRTLRIVLPSVQNVGVHVGHDRECRRDPQSFLDN